MPKASTFRRVPRPSMPCTHSTQASPPRSAPAKRFSPIAAVFPSTPTRRFSRARSSASSRAAIGVPDRSPNRSRDARRISRDILRRLPKAELHCHLDGSVRPQTLLDLGREHDVAMPATTASAMAEFMRVDDARNLEDYLKRFDVTLSVMQTAASLDRIAFELAEDAAAEGVRYIEVRYAPVLNVRAGLSLDEAVEAGVRGLGRARQQHGIEGRVIITALRNHSPAE